MGSGELGLVQCVSSLMQGDAAVSRSLGVCLDELSIKSVRSRIRSSYLRRQLIDRLQRDTPRHPGQVNDFPVRHESAILGLSLPYPFELTLSRGTGMSNSQARRHSFSIKSAHLNDRIFSGPSANRIVQPAPE